MTDYSDLVKRLRGKKLNCTCAARSASECCCNTYWPESSCNEAADAIEDLIKRIKMLEAPLCIGETTIRILAKTGACDFEDGRCLIAADELFRQDPYTRIAELEAALKPFTFELLPQHNVFGCKQVFIKPEELAAARKVLGEEE